MRPNKIVIENYTLLIFLYAFKWGNRTIYEINIKEQLKIKLKRFMTKTISTLSMVIIEAYSFRIKSPISIVIATVFYTRLQRKRQKYSIYQIMIS